MEARKRLALVTGASSGIGRACADKLVEAGFEVLAGVRSEHQSSLPSAVSPVRLDVTCQTTIDTLPEIIANHSRVGLALLVNNAGVGLAGPLETATSEEIERTVATNLTGVIRVIQGCLPALRQSSDHGVPSRIINIGSVQSYHAIPLCSVYSATKFGTRGLTDALRIELAPLGISVVAIEPGSTATSIWKKGKAQLDELRRVSSPELLAKYHVNGFAEALQAVASRGIPAAAVAKVVVRAATARRPRARYLVGSDARASSAVRLLPLRWRDFVTQRMVGVHRDS